MPLEAELTWSSEHGSHRERLLLADPAFLADGRWARAAGRAELDASPWITPAGLAPLGSSYPKRMTPS